MGLQEKQEDKDEKHIRKLIIKIPNITGAYNSTSKQSRSQVQRKHSADKEFRV